MSDTENGGGVNNGPAVDPEVAERGADPRNSGGDPALPGGMELAAGPDGKKPEYQNVFRDGQPVASTGGEPVSKDEERRLAEEGAARQGADAEAERGPE